MGEKLKLAELEKHKNEILNKKKNNLFPEWFESLREYAPGYPLELYAVAWKYNKNEADQQLARAVNWILDEGQKFMKARPDEFDQIAALILPQKVEDLLPEQIPDYVVDKNHEFWDAKYATHSMGDILKLHKK